MLALIAGTGDLPAELIARLPQKPLVCALHSTQVAVPVDIWFRIEMLGSFLADLRGRGVTAICMAGGVDRPVIDPAAVDAATAPLVPKIIAAIGAGDDGALRAMIEIITDHGLSVRGAHEIAPDLLPVAGVMTQAKPSGDAFAAAVVGEKAVQVLGRADQGQACVVIGGKVTAWEDATGTAAMLARLRGQGQGGVLYKGPKPGQDRRADLPVIGPQTVAQANDAGLDTIVIAAGGVMVLHADRVVAQADDAGMVIWVRPETEGPLP